MCTHSTQKHAPHHAPNAMHDMRSSRGAAHVRFLTRGAQRPGACQHHTASLTSSKTLLLKCNYLSHMPKKAAQNRAEKCSNTVCLCVGLSGHALVLIAHIRNACTCAENTLTHAKLRTRFPPVCNTICSSVYYSLSFPRRRRRARRKH